MTLILYFYAQNIKMIKNLYHFTKQRCLMNLEDVLAELKLKSLFFLYSWKQLLFETFSPFHLVYGLFDFLN